MIFGNNTHAHNAQCRRRRRKILIFIIICGKFTDIIKMEDYCNFIQFLLFLVSLAYTAIKKYLQ